MVKLMHMPSCPIASDQRSPCTAAQRIAHKLMTVDMLARQRDKQIANGYLARIDSHRAERRLIMQRRERPIDAPRQIHTRNDVGKLNHNGLCSGIKRGAL